jgi:hypothetical protein
MEGTNTYGDWRLGEFFNLALLRDDYRADTNFPSRPTPQSAGADVLYALDKYDVEWTQLRAAADRPFAQFLHRYTPLEVFDRDMDYYSVAKSFAVMARNRAVAHLSEGNPTEARLDIVVGLRFRDALSVEPSVLSPLVAQALSEVLASAIWAGLTRHQWAEADLVALDAALGRTDHFTSGFNSLRGERNSVSFRSLDLMLEQPGLIPISPSDGYAFGIESSEPPAWQVWAFQFFVVHNKANTGKLVRRCLRSMDVVQRCVYPSVAAEFESEMEAFKRIAWRKPYHILGALLMPAYGKTQIKFCYAATTVDLARAAIALERHRLRHGGFPESLEALDAAVLPAGGLPNDLVTGGPLRYRRTDNGRFDLYAVGWNGTDDGGVTAWQNESKGIPDRTQGDWVWPQPAE